ncbi:class II glutamine amidotransferase [Yoonia sp. F2084L]|uniref:class II glutamine amidotransferase n=1 Tax=Yoonia sp. F2084L TaxID=2926419 RepID=UPI001FF3AB5A|nr:class II glutamine amidotransferase [Yoonia sp. F2084L]MCK0096020.1 class II glutamine amidotransferase [Yoonia sp. F2084L]
MCRIAAYTGPEIPLENIIVRPAHSLLEQSQHAAEAKLAVNGDGFGISWYGVDEAPGLYRDVLPAWADDNLINLCRMVRSHHFIAHIRASTVGETSRTNCHPFTFGKWSFCHNGQIPHFKRIRRAMLAALPDELFEARRGTTDSEMIFLTLLANGLDRDPAVAMRATLDQIGPAGDEGPTKLTCVFSDGQTLYAFRHASGGQAPSLYASGVLDNGGRSMASEPLCGVAARWTEIPTDTVCALTAEGLAMTPLAVRVAV